MYAFYITANLFSISGDILLCLARIISPFRRCFEVVRPGHLGSEGNALDNSVLSQ